MVFSSLPQFAAELLGPVPSGDAVLDAKSVGMMAGEMNLSLPQLTGLLLGFAASYARPSISGFRVGAIAQGLVDDSGWPALYFGGNVEFDGDSLSHTVHAEQAATLNAWLHSEQGLSGITVSSPPCGYCRQFLHELKDAADITVTVAGEAGNHSQMRLGELLPKAFGPDDLGLEAALMADTGRARLEGADLPGDELTLEAIEAAERSYAPYTRGYAGCAIQTGDRIVQGRYAENAAFNPGVSAIRCGIVALSLTGPDPDPSDVQRVVVVEARSSISQFDETRCLAARLFPDARVELHRAALVG